jgi:hypothetical protein
MTHNGDDAGAALLVDRLQRLVHSLCDLPVRFAADRLVRAACGSSSSSIWVTIEDLLD